ncbi:hypothetical protein [Sphingobium yanoikuyae]|uniref:hypothetical protein n=1 Tax=Sphingobium yanoikuyae TaxID=13690 RepID=UPI0028B25754|nr:hypothetical protein [Sphingobium yanoikuyae]
MSLKLSEKIDISIERIKSNGKVPVKIYLNHVSLEKIRTGNYLIDGSYNGIPVKINMIGLYNRIVTDDGMSWKI